MAFLLKKHTENYTCLSTDVKSVAVQAGSRCEELDTGKQYIFDGVNWNEIVGATSLTGSLPKSEMEIYGTSIATRPDADAVEIGACFIIVDPLAIYMSDGTNWVVQ